MFTPSTWIEQLCTGEEVVKGVGAIEKARWALVRSSSGRVLLLDAHDRVPQNRNVSFAMKRWAQKHNAPSRKNVQRRVT